MVSIPSRFRGRARRDAAAFYLSQLARGILAGELAVLEGHETVPVRPADFLLLEILIGHKGRANHVSIRVRWPRSRVSGSATPPRRAPRTRGGPRAASHLQFTPSSLERNPGTPDSHPDANAG